MEAPGAFAYARAAGDHFSTTWRDVITDRAHRCSPRGKVAHPEALEPMLVEGISHLGTEVSDGINGLEPMPQDAS